jgi:hypothetical protein
MIFPTQWLFSIDLKFYKDIKTEVWFFKEASRMTPVLNNISVEI